MNTYPFKQVDVFAGQPLSGNPVAVVMNAAGLSTAAMQSLARWTNLSETTFVLPGTPGVSDYHLRIFTPHGELPFAGHPTIGTAHALLEAGLVQARQGRLVQSCHAGLIQLQVNEQEGQRWIGFDLPTPTVTRLSPDQLQQISASLALDAGQVLDARIIDVGPKWVVVRLNSDNEVRRLQPDLAHMASCDRAQRQGHNASHGGTLVRTVTRHLRRSRLRQWQRLRGRIRARADAARSVPRGLHRPARHGHRARRQDTHQLQRTQHPCGGASRHGHPWPFDAFIHCLTSP